MIYCQRVAGRVASFFLCDECKNRVDNLSEAWVLMPDTTPLEDPGAIDVPRIYHPQCIKDEPQQPFAVRGGEFLYHLLMSGNPGP